MSIFKRLFLLFLLIFFFYVSSLALVEYYFHRWPIHTVTGMDTAAIFKDGHYEIGRSCDQYGLTYRENVSTFSRTLINDFLNFDYDYLGYNVFMIGVNHSGSTKFAYYILYSDIDKLERYYLKSEIPASFQARFEILEREIDKADPSFYPKTRAYPYPKSVLLDSESSKSLELPENDPDLISAINEARTSVDSFIEAIQNGKAKNYSIRFLFQDGPVKRHAVLYQPRFENGFFFGVYKTFPQCFSNVRFQYDIKISKEEISDWSYADENGRQMGEFIIKATFKIWPKKSVEFFKKCYKW